MKRIQILGPGCQRCDRLAANAEAAVREAGVSAVVQRVTDIAAILEVGVLTTPALLIDGEVKAVGRVLSPAEIRALLI